MADFPAAIVPKPHHPFIQLRRAVPDIAEWQLKQDDWRRQESNGAEKHVCGSTVMDAGSCGIDIHEEYHNRRV